MFWGCIYETKVVKKVTAITHRTSTEEQERAKAWEELCIKQPTDSTNLASGNVKEKQYLGVTNTNADNAGDTARQLQLTQYTTYIH